MGIILFHRPMEKLWSPSNGFVRKVWSLAVMSISAQLLTTPVSLMLQGFPHLVPASGSCGGRCRGLPVYGGVALIAVACRAIRERCIGIAGLRCHQRLAKWMWQPALSRSCPSPHLAVRKPVGPKRLSGTC
ncbi:MAG: hypothetical protein IPJ85_13655 [Flavobacteriales bacterium]|nr:hypothetical protein [Flavobacteriales bacterium]